MNRSWIIFSYQLVSTTSTLRVRAWRILKRIGALPLQQSVSVVPMTNFVVRKLETLRQLIEDAGGKVIWLDVPSFGEKSERDLIERFNRVISDEYQEFIQDCAAFFPSSLDEPNIDVQRLRKSLKKIMNRDYFECPLASLAIKELANVERIFRTHLQSKST